MMRPGAIIAFATVIGACGSDTGPQQRVATPAAAPPAARPSVDPELVRTLAILATDREPTRDQVAATERALAAGTLTLPAYIDSLVATEDFATRVAPLAIMRNVLTQGAASAPSRFVLSQTTGPDPYFYLDDTPCPANQTVAVHPWWDLDSTVKICSDAYRPAQWQGRPKKGDISMACLSGVGATLVSDGGGQSRCGCGPYLMRCFRSADQRHEVIASLRAELADTVTHAVDRDLPAENVFTANETVRDRNAEYVRREAVLEARRGADAEHVFRDLASWPATGTWAAREELAPGEHAGLVTSPIILYNQNDLRQRMTVIYDVLWCMQPDSVGATPESVIGIHDPNLQLSSSGWQKLAARPLCENCHARLDYGQQFFKGFPHGNTQAFFTADHQLTGRGPLYSANHDDPRGDAELDPQGFAQLAVAQPEFRSCMAHDFAAYVFGDRLSTELLEQVEAAATVPGKTSIRGLMRAALAALAADWSRRTPAESARLVSRVASGEDVAVTAELKKQLDAHCLDCHDAKPGLVDLSRPSLSRMTVVGMLGNVAFGRMPKDRPLGDDARREFVDAFLPAVFTGADLDAARAFFVGRQAALPAYRPEVVLDMLHQRVGAAEALPWRILEKYAASQLMQVTPGLVTVHGVAAVEACRAAHSEHADVERCIDDAIASQPLTIAPN